MRSFVGRHSCVSYYLFLFVGLTWSSSLIHCSLHWIIIVKSVRVLSNSTKIARKRRRQRSRAQRNILVLRARVGLSCCTVSASTLFFFLQICLYVFSRVLLGLSKSAVNHGLIPRSLGEPSRLFGALVWGIVLWQFEYQKDTLQPSLQTSMTYLYKDSNVWHGIRDFLIYNK